MKIAGRYLWVASLVLLFVLVAIGVLTDEEIRIYWQHQIRSFPERPLKNQFFMGVKIWLVLAIITGIVWHQFEPDEGEGIFWLIYFIVIIAWLILIFLSFFFWSLIKPKESLELGWFAIMILWPPVTTVIILIYVYLRRKRC